MRNRRGFCSNPIGSYYKEEAEKLPVWSIKACQKDMPMKGMKTASNILK